MPLAEEITQAQRAYTNLRKARAKEVCGDLPGFEQGVWRYHPERCSKKGSSLRHRNTQKRQLNSIDEMKTATEQSLRESLSTRKKKPLQRDARILRHVYEAVLEDVPRFIEHVATILIHPQSVREEPDVQARYDKAVASWQGISALKNDLSIKLSILRLAENLLIHRW